MQVTPAVEAILGNHGSDNPGGKAGPARTLVRGKLGSTGEPAIPPVDQGFEHGPARSFALRPPAYRPDCHVKLALAAAAQVTRPSAAAQVTRPSQMSAASQRAGAE